MWHIYHLLPACRDRSRRSGCRFWRLGGGSSGGCQRRWRAAPSMRGVEMPHFDRGWEGRQPAATARLAWCGSPAADCTFIRGVVSVIHFTPLPVSPPLRLTAALPVAGPRDGGGGEERRRGRCRRAHEPRPSRAGPARLCRDRVEAVRLSRPPAEPPDSSRSLRGEHIAGLVALATTNTSRAARIC